MAPIMEQLGRHVAEWRASLLDKGLKVNAGNSKVIVRSSGGKMIVNSGKWPCGVCGKVLQANSVQCTVCKKWILTNSHFLASTKKLYTETGILPFVTLVKYRIGLLMLKIAKHTVPISISRLL